MRLSERGRRPSIEQDAILIGEAMRAIRKMRRMAKTEVARLMGMPPRSYDHLEAGTGKITYGRIVAFAEATSSDHIAILTTPAFGSPDLALRCADNKLMTIMMIAMRQLDGNLGDDIALLEAGTLVGGFTRLTKDLVDHIRKRDTFAEEWVKQGSTNFAPRRGTLRPARS